mmetsp:Transcript_64349/g.178848  ORF Transcript_64349/g.178848 Transcript_64349/m.178848 type:complete len:212 (+) Transcript_64349:39-674(+)
MPDNLSLRRSRLRQRNGEAELRRAHGRKADHHDVVLLQHLMRNPPAVHERAIQRSAIHKHNLAAVSSCEYPRVPARNHAWDVRTVEGEVAEHRIPTDNKFVNGDVDHSACVADEVNNAPASEPWSNAAPFCRRARCDRGRRYRRGPRRKVGGLPATCRASLRRRLRWRHCGRGTSATIVDALPKCGVMGKLCGAFRDVAAIVSMKLRGEFG